jgi:hypothetical protein
MQEVLATILRTQVFPMSPTPFLRDLATGFRVPRGFRVRGRLFEGLEVIGFGKADWKTKKFRGFGDLLWLSYAKHGAPIRVGHVLQSDSGLRCGW